MNDLENELRAALRREKAPDDFAAKVTARVRADAKLRPTPWVRRPMTLALAAGLTALAIIPAVVMEHERVEREAGLKAKHDLLIALSITRNQLQHARSHVLRANRMDQ